MASPSKKPRRPAHPRVTFDTNKFENVHQVGGIQTAMLESPTGSGQRRRVALFNTGSPLRFTVALDRGGDIVDAFHGQHSLTYLTAGGIKAPSHAYNRGMEWLAGWPGGLVTCCGPEFIGGARREDDKDVNLHGHHSNTPAAVEMLINPDPHRGRHEMMLALIVRDTCMFGPHIELRRTIICTLGIAELRIFDEITNRGNQPCAHNWLYHVNFGYPLVDKGARLIYAGKIQYIQNPPPTKSPTDAQLNAMKRIEAPIRQHQGGGERCLIVDPKTARDGCAHVGLINKKLPLGVHLIFPTDALPRMTNWQHYGPCGSYITALEPFNGSLLGKDNDDHPLAKQILKPGQTRRYQITLRVVTSPGDLQKLSRYDGKVSGI